MYIRAATSDLSNAEKTGLLESAFHRDEATALEFAPTTNEQSPVQNAYRPRLSNNRLGKQSDEHSDKMNLFNKIPFFLIASLLMATSMGKVWMLLTDPFADIRVGIPKEFLWITVVFELWLAFENWRIRDHRVLALVNTVTFALFAVFAGIRWALGHASCGCAGNFELPPWLFLLLDMVLVAWFLSNVNRQLAVLEGTKQLATWWTGCSTAVKGRLAGLLLFVYFLCMLQLPIAAPLRSFVIGEPPIQAITRVDGEMVRGKESIGEVEIWNRSNQPAKIIGMARSCSCFKLVEVPVWRLIPPQERFAFPLAVKPIKSGPLHERVVLYLDHPIQFRMNIDVVGSVSVSGVEK